ncbi:MAG: SAM-dependent chlorinase/fluorinase [Acidimicrobiia bacterium]|nr:SAM-dependent chlorinase/fluorinase [Acidimicrobiia bacterium]
MPEPLPVSFLSDFGLDDEFVGVVHGVIARIAPEVRVIDVTHGVPRGDVRAGALTLMRAIQYLPQGVALAVVDPGVGTDRRAIAAETPWGYFVGPDNGLLSPAAAIVGGSIRVVTIENSDLVLPSLGATFDGRDRFAPAAAVLASGQATLDEIGSPVAPDDITPMILPLPDLGEASIEAEAWWVDTFGNVQLNVGPEDLAQIGVSVGGLIEVIVGPLKRQATWVRSYGDVDAGRPLIHVDSTGMMALAVREGSGSEFFVVRSGGQVTLRKP